MTDNTYQVWSYSNGSAVSEHELICDGLSQELALHICHNHKHTPDGTTYYMRLPGAPTYHISIVHRNGAKVPHSVHYSEHDARLASAALERTLQSPNTTIQQGAIVVMNMDYTTGRIENQVSQIDMDGPIGSFETEDNDDDTGECEDIATIMNRYGLLNARPDQ